MRFSTFIRDNPVGMLLFAVFGGLVSTYLWETFKPPSMVKPESYEQSPRGGVPPFSQCLPGQVIVPASDAFLLRFVAIENGDAVQRAMESAPDDYARKIRDSIRAGEISRLKTAASATVRLYGVPTSRIPVEVPLLNEKNICIRMVTVTPADDAEARFVIPFGISEASPEGSILFPRRAFETSPNVRVCVEPTFVLAYPTETRQNMYCGINLNTSALRGASSRTFILARAN